jgi:uncharacterized protein involved in exopolysaccharide biosynthesis
MNIHSQITFSQILGALAKHKFKALLSFLLVMVLVLGVFLVWPRKYGSEGKMFVQIGRTNTGLNPTPDSMSVSIQDSRETEIRSVVELVKSRAIIETVVDEIGPEKILENPLNKFFDIKISFPDMPWNKSEGSAMSKEELKRLKQRELAAKKLLASIRVDSEKKTSVISVYCKAASADLAQKIVGSVMQKTIEKHVDVHSIKSSTKFFDDEFERQQLAVVDAVKRFRTFRNENKFLSIEGATSTLQSVIDKLEQNIIDVNASVAEAKERVYRLQEEMETINPNIIVPTTGVEKLSYEDSSTLYFQLKSEAEELEKRFTPNHPQIPPLRARMAELKKQLDAMSVERTESAMQANPVYDEIKVALVRAEADYKSFEAKLKNLEEMYTSSLADLKDLNDKQVVADQYQRDIDVAKQYLAIYIQKRGEASVMDQLDQQRISDVVVAQEATYEVKHVSPKGSLIIPLGAMLASVCCIATVLYFERDLVSGTLSEEEVEQILEIPILVTLPRVTSHRNMVA